MQNLNSNKKTEVFILLDKSGSMGSTWNTTIDGIKGFIDELKTTEGEVFISLATFSDECTLNVEHVNLNNFDHNTLLEIKVAGMTAVTLTFLNIYQR